MLVLGCDRLSSSLELLKKDHDIKAVSILSNGALVLCREKCSTDYNSPKPYSVKYISDDEKNGPEEIEYFRDRNIVNLFGGDAHAIIIEENGKVHGWGCNSHGQISTTEESEGMSSFVSIPICIPLNFVVQVACGKSHTLFLLKTSELYALGSNAYGQLGIVSGNDVSQPVRVAPPCLLGVPISLIVAGGWHSFCVTLSGRVFSWGQNDCGQLGLGNVENQSSPQLMEGFSHNSVSFIAAGEQHNAILTRNGELFTFGQGADGQLGHGDVKNELAPRTVEELEGSVVTQVACGAKHTVAYVPACKKIFVFGSNENGQLGDTKDVCRPILEPKILNDGAPIVNFHNIYAHGTVTCLLDWPQAPNDFRLISKQGKVMTLEDICENAEISNVAFTSAPNIFLNCFNASFFLDDQLCSIESPAIDFDAVHETAETLTKDLSEEGFSTFSASVREVLKALGHNPCDIEALRVCITFPTLMENIRKILTYGKRPQAQNQILLTKQLTVTFIMTFMHLKQERTNKILTKWYQSFGHDSFSLILDIYKFRLEDCVKSGKIVEPFRTFLLKHLKILNDINNDKQLLRFEAFYLDEVRGEGLLTEYVWWIQKRNGKPEWKEVSLLFEYPFLLNAKAKCLMLEFSTKQRLQLSRHMIIPANVLVLSREGDIVAKMKTALDTKSDLDLKRPLQIRFQDEVGHDGASLKELFMLVFEQILKSQCGLFVEDENSKFLWFDKRVSSENNKLYNFVGKLCGLSVYNSIVINLNFPLALYKKLLGVQTGLGDLKELNPTFGTSLQQILTFVEDDGMTMEDLFVSFTTTDGVPLKEGGEEIPVTVANREEYVELYVNYLLDLSVQQQFEAFRSGFLAVFVGEDILLELFTPEELMSMVSGTQNYDWNELKKNTTYHMFRPEDQTIVWFWEVLLSMSEEQKQEFLVYLTGSNKVPISGLTMKIAKVCECDKFPPLVAVCYNTLYLHPYSTKDILENRLKTGIKCKGFYMK